MEVTLNELQKMGSEILKNVAQVCENNNIPWYMAYGSLLGAIRHKGPIPWDYDIDIYIPNNQITQFVEIMKKELPSNYWVDYRDNPKMSRSFPRIGLTGYETEILHVDVYRLSGLPENSFSFKLFALYSRILFVFWKSKVIDINSYYPDRKRRVIARTARCLSTFISIDWLLKQLDKQASKIPLDKARFASCPYETQNLSKRVPKNIFDETLLVDYEDFKVRVPKEYEKYLEIEYGDWKSLPPREEQDRMLNKMYTLNKI